MENTQSEQQKENRLKWIEQNLKDLWDYNKKNLIFVSLKSQREERKGGTEKVLKK